MNRHLTCTANEWLQNADAILAVTPLAEVTLTTMPNLITDASTPVCVKTKTVRFWLDGLEDRCVRSFSWLSIRPGHGEIVNDLLTAIFFGVKFTLPRILVPYRVEDFTPRFVYPLS